MTQVPSPRRQLAGRRRSEFFMTLLFPALQMLESLRPSYLLASNTQYYTLFLR
jgi:hypothetical protein